MIGSAAFLAPEIGTDPCSGRPPVISNLSILLCFFRREGLHRQRVNLLAHAIAQRLVDELVALHAALASEGGRNDHRLEMLPVANHLDSFAVKSRLDPALYAFRSDHCHCLSL